MFLSFQKRYPPGLFKCVLTNFLSKFILELHHTNQQNIQIFAKLKNEKIFRFSESATYKIFQILRGIYSVTFSLH